MLIVDSSVKSGDFRMEFCYSGHFFIRARAYLCACSDIPLQELQTLNSFRNMDYFLMTRGSGSA
jgi:hypothetical protein